MKFDAKELSDQELVVLESTLRVQLAVAKHVRVQQITSAIGGALLTAGLSTLLSGPSIVCSTVLRKKCKRRYFATRRELFLRNVEVAPIQETRLAKRALALSIASGLTCCVLGVALDVLVDGAVLQVVAFFFGTAFEGHVTGRTTGFVHDNAPELVGRDQVYVIDEAPFALFGARAGANSGAGDTSGDNATNEATKTSSKFRAKSLVDMSRQLWKNASWSFSSAEIQAKIKDARETYRYRPSMHGSFSRSIHEGDDGSDNWAFLFAQNHHEFQADTDADNGDEERGHETLFGCRMRAPTTLFGTSLDDFGPDVEEEQVELVRSDAFSLFGDCYVVHVRHASAVVSPRTQPQSSSHLETKRSPADTYKDLFACEPTEDFDDEDGDDTTVVHVIPCGEDDLSANLVPDRPQQYEKSLVFTGDEASCAFWDGIWHLDDDDLDNQEDVEYGVEVWGFDDDVEEEEYGDDVKVHHHHTSLEPEYSVEVWDYDDDDNNDPLFPTTKEPLASVPLSPPYPNCKHADAVKEEVSYDALSLFGSLHESLDSGSRTKYLQYHDEEEVDDFGPEAYQSVEALAQPGSARETTGVEMGPIASPRKSQQPQPTGLDAKAMYLDADGVMRRSEKVTQRMVHRGFSIKNAHLLTDNDQLHMSLSGRLKENDARNAKLVQELDELTKKQAANAKMKLQTKSERRQWIDESNELITTRLELWYSNDFVPKDDENVDVTEHNTPLSPSKLQRFIDEGGNLRRKLVPDANWNSSFGPSTSPTSATTTAQQQEHPNNQMPYVEVVTPPISPT